MLSSSARIAALRRRSGLYLTHALPCGPRYALRLDDLTQFRHVNREAARETSVLPFFESQLMSYPLSKKMERARRLQGALSRWENEGGSPNGPAPVPPAGGHDGVPPLTNAELVQLQIRVIALENLVAALLANAPERQLELVRDIAASIFPRPGVEHRLTIQASAHMEHLVQRSRRLQACLAPCTDDPLKEHIIQKR